MKALSALEAPCKVRVNVHLADDVRALVLKQEYAQEFCNSESVTGRPRLILLGGAESASGAPYGSFSRNLIVDRAVAEVDALDVRHCLLGALQTVLHLRHSIQPFVRGLVAYVFGRRNHSAEKCDREVRDGGCHMVAMTRTSTCCGAVCTWCGKASTCLINDQDARSAAVEGAVRRQDAHRTGAPADHGPVPISSASECTSRCSTQARGLSAGRRSSCSTGHVDYSSRNKGQGPRARGTDQTATVVPSPTWPNLSAPPVAQATGSVISTSAVGILAVLMITARYFARE